MKNNPDKQFILKYLNLLGFVDTGKKGFGDNQRMTHSKVRVGSIYVGNSYISGTGGYKKIQNKVHPSSYDWKKYPEWKANQALKLLEYLKSNF